ncbi:ABC transporter permease [Micromonospora sp. NPDC049903]|uniref:ABC transporter permease n=1 Tax=Micromonospora sp. NPDC049903 TaxID=3364276 RepID=UPI0037AC578B
MRAYRTLARMAWSTVLVYRGEFLLQLAGVAVQTVALFAVWRALFAADPGGEMAGLTWEQMKAYLFVAFLAGTLLSSFTDGQVALRVLDGSVAIDLLRPIDYQLARFAETIGYLVGELLVVAVMGSVLLLAFGGMPLPDPTQTGLFLLSLLAMVPLKFALVYLVGLACFWTGNFHGLSMSRIAITNILSGALVPIALYPGWLQTICAWSPFPGIVSTPALIFLGQVRGTESLHLIGLQVLWVAVLWIGARLLWRVAVRRLVVHGG